MKTLELKHLAPYLPYKLRVQVNNKSYAEVMTGLDLDVWFEDYNTDSFKPILHPLSDLTKEIEHNGKKFNPLKTLGKASSFYGISPSMYVDYYKEWEVWEYDYLLQWHFDVFGLIEAGLAIDINTLKEKQ